MNRKTYHTLLFYCCAFFICIPSLRAQPVDCEKDIKFILETFRHNYAGFPTLHSQYGETELDTSNYLKTEIADKNLPFGGHWEYTLTAEGKDSTKLEISENGEVYDPFFRFINTIFMDQTATMQAFLDDLELKINEQ